MPQWALGDSNGCWVDLFGVKRCRGKSLRLYGPADFPMLRIREDRSPPDVQSLRIGPHAYVQCFEQARFADSVIWLLPNELVEDVGRLRSPERIDSMRLWDRPPFAHEPGYTAYMLWAASRVARAG